MPLNKAFMAELQYETSLTRKLLQRIPADKLNWKPHEKSMSLSRLATHIADIHGWPVYMLAASEFDVAITSLAPVPLNTVDEILHSLDGKVNRAMAVLETADDEQIAQPWTFRRGEHIIFSMPRKQVLRGMVINHIVHHRGQLSVYLRLLDVPIPSIYGPSADEQIF